MSALLGKPFTGTIDMSSTLLPQRCLKERLRFLFREGEALLSPVALTNTLDACGLVSSSSDYSFQEVSRFALARTMRVIEGWSYREIKQGFEGGNFLIENDVSDSIESMGECFRQEVYSRKSKADLSREHDISLDTVSATLWAIGIPTKRRLYSSQDWMNFANARTLLECCHLTYFQLKKYFDGTHCLEEKMENCLDVRYTKLELADVFQLSVRTVTRTLQACGLSTQQQSYSSLEFLCFKQARQSIELEGMSYAQVAQYFSN